MENEEKKKKGIGKKVALWLIGVIVVLGIIGFLDEDTTPTNSDVVGSSENITNSVNIEDNEENKIPSYIIKSGITPSGYSFNFDMNEFIEKYNKIQDNKNFSQSFVDLFKISYSDFVDNSAYIPNNEYNVKSYFYQPANTNNGIALTIDRNGNLYLAKYITAGSINSKGLGKSILMTVTGMSEDRAENILTRCANKIGEVFYDDEYYVTYGCYRSEDGYLHFDVTPYVE